MIDGFADRESGEDKVVTFRITIAMQAEGWGTVDALYLHGDGSVEIVELSNGNPVKQQA